MWNVVCKSVCRDFFVKKDFFFLAQETLTSFYGAIRIYCFNRAEMEFGAGKMRKGKKEERK